MTTVTTTEEPQAPTVNLSRHAGSKLATIAEVIEEMQVTRGEVVNPRQVARWVRAWARLSTFQLYQQIKDWQEALDNGLTGHHRRFWNEVRRDIALRVWESQPFRLPQFTEVTGESKSIRKQFLTFSIEQMKGALDYGCGVDNTLLSMQIRQFEAKLESKNY